LAKDYRPVTSVDTLRNQMQEAGHQFKRNQTERNTLADEMAALARRGADAGMTEREMADLLGVDRARTLRRWLGK
jgi:predicted transcriptional regulator